MVVEQRHRDKIIEEVDCIVIGAGVIGLACARALSLKGLEVVILESHEGIGMETSSRHSEVIHAGIYYPAGTNKAKWCVQGKQQLYAYCDTNHIPYKRIGKLIVAINEHELTTLEDINTKAKGNGVHDLQFLSAQEVHALEPNVKAVGALFSPSTGIIDSHAYMLSLLGQAQANGAMLAVNSVVQGGVINDDNIILRVTVGVEAMQLSSKLVINCAGLYASRVAQSIVGIPIAQIPETYFRKGDYFTYSKRNLFTHLIYPVPVAGGLGTHSTMDLAGQVRFGPDVEWIEQINYDVDANKRHEFSESIARFYPSVQTELLQAGYAGIRPTLADRQGGFRDFCIQRHALGNDQICMIGLYGIESPGLTSSLAIADAVAALVSVN